LPVRHQVEADIARCSRRDQKIDARGVPQQRERQRRVALWQKGNGAGSVASTMHLRITGQRRRDNRKCGR
jgi:hypothetical protein